MRLAARTMKPISVARYVVQIFAVTQVIFRVGLYYCKTNQRAPGLYDLPYGVMVRVRID